MTIGIASLQFGERSYFALSTQVLSRYAGRHGYQLFIGDGGNFSDGRDRRWGKLPLISWALESCDLVLYLDADCVVVDHSQIVESLASSLMSTCDLLVGRDSFWNANTGVMLFRRTAIDILDAWGLVPTQHPETANTWPVDELGFNRYVLPAFAKRIAAPHRVVGTMNDFVTGPFVKHFMNGNETTKLAAMSRELEKAPE